MNDTQSERWWKGSGQLAGLADETGDAEEDQVRCVQHRYQTPAKAGHPSNNDHCSKDKGGVSPFVPRFFLLMLHVRKSKMKWYVNLNLHTQLYSQVSRLEVCISAILDLLSFVISS